MSPDFIFMRPLGHKVNLRYGDSPVSETEDVTYDFKKLNFDNKYSVKKELDELKNVYSFLYNDSPKGMTVGEFMLRHATDFAKQKKDIEDYAFKYSNDMVNLAFKEAGFKTENQYTSKLEVKDFSINVHIFQDNMKFELWKTNGRIEIASKKVDYTPDMKNVIDTYDTICNLINALLILNNK